MMNSDKQKKSNCTCFLTSSFHICNHFTLQPQNFFWLNNEFYLEIKIPRAQDSVTYSRNWR